MFTKIAALCLLALASTLAYPSSLTRDSCRIMGGHEAERGQFPYSISLQYGFQLTHSHVCGGSILNTRWVLTAGRCVTKVPPNPLVNFYVIAGIHNLKENGQKIRVKRIIVHPDYAGGVNPNDIALLELEEELKFGENVSAVQLPERDFIPFGDGTLSGWGNASNIGYWPNNDLLTIDLPFVTIEECAAALRRLFGTSEPLNGASNVCTGRLQVGEEGPCWGDSGSPLVAQGTNEQVGIVSWRIEPCGTLGAPAIFTRVSTFIPWINENIH